MWALPTPALAVWQEASHRTALRLSIAGAPLRKRIALATPSIGRGSLRCARTYLLTAHRRAKESRPVGRLVGLAGWLGTAGLGNRWQGVTVERIRYRLRVAF